MVKFYSLICAAVIGAFCAQAQVDYTMNNWSVNPANGAKVSEIEKVTVHFDGLYDGIDSHILNYNAPNYISITCGDEVYYPINFEAGTVDIDDLVLTFNPITKAGTYTLNIKEGVVCDYDQKESHDEGEGYSVNPPITAEWTIDAAVMNNWILTPESGSVITMFKNFRIEFPDTEERDGIDEYAWDCCKHITLTCGDKVYHPIDGDLSSDYYGFNFEFDEITEPGKYVLCIDADTFVDYESWEYTNPVIYAYYEILPTVGINALDENPDALKGVYDLQGRKLNVEASNVSNLSAGLYIVNGKKIVVRK